ncbi:hypothetical protein OSTOST_08115 [Ostertagia ostertagi]
MRKYITYTLLEWLTSKENKIGGAKIVLASKRVKERIDFRPRSNVFDNGTISYKSDQY